MKKIVALLLALVMLTGLTVTALAAIEDKSGTTKLTVVVPEADYTIHVPADVTLEFGNTTKQNIGAAYVTDVTGISNPNYLECYLNTSTLASGSNTIPYTVYYERGTYSQSFDGGTSFGFDVYGIDGDGNFGDIYPENANFSVQIAKADWTAAVPGTYTSTWTFTFTIQDE